MKKILYADDNSLDIKYVTKVIKAMDLDYEVLTAENGVEALEIWRKLRDTKVKLDLVLIDNHMGEFSGIETIKYLRLENFTGPAFILTADKNVKNTSPQDIDDVFYKPLNRHHVYEALQYLKNDQKKETEVFSLEALSDIIDSLDSQMVPEQDPLNDWKFNIKCNFRNLNSSSKFDSADIINITTNEVCLLSRKPLYRDTKISIQVNEPLNLDFDAIITRHRKKDNNYIYCCKFLYIRKALF